MKFEGLYGYTATALDNEITRIMQPLETLSKYTKTKRHLMHYQATSFACFSQYFTGRRSWFASRVKSAAFITLHAAGNHEDLDLLLEGFCDSYNKAPERFFMHIEDKGLPEFPFQPTAVFPS